MMTSVYNVLWRDIFLLPDVSLGQFGKGNILMGHRQIKNLLLIMFLVLGTSYQKQTII